MQEYELLEKEWAEYCALPVENVSVCSSGTAALHLALEAFRFKLGSEVILPDYTMIACARAVALAGLTPVFVDCKADDLTMDPDLIRGAMSSKTVAIMAVSVYGRSSDLGAIMEEAPDLPVIEDLAEDPIEEVGRSLVIPAAMCWSFYANKIVAGEEGGAVFLHNQARSDLVKSLRCIGFTEHHDYNHIPRGHNYRLSNANAKLVRESLKKVWENRSYRNRVIDAYDALLPPEWRMESRNSPWVYDIRIPGMGGITQALVVTELQRIGIAARYGFKPLSSQEEFRGCRLVGSREAYKARSEVFYLPTIQKGVDLINEAERIINLIKSLVR